MTAETLDFTRQNFNFIVAENAIKSEQIFHLEQAKLSFEKDKILWEQENLDLKNKYNYLLEQIRLMKQRQFAKKTEQMSGLTQKDLIFDDAEPEEKEVEEPITETISYTRQKKQVGRRIDTSKLPREQIVHDLSAEEKKCVTCGKELEKIGEDTSEQLEYIPAQLKVIEHIRPKYTCRCCETIKSAEKPESPIAKSMAGASLISDVIIKKYDHHLPWYRQAKIFAQAGIDIPANTIGNWFMQAGVVLEPLKIALWEQLDQIKVLQVDETRVKILAGDLKGYMWVYHSYDPENKFAIFEYNQGRGQVVVNKTLENYQGILQSDGYSGYNWMRKKDGVIQLGCWAHCRRKFFEIVKLTKKAGTAHAMVGLIKQLYEIEEKARSQKLNFNARRELRQKDAKPIIEKIHNCITKAQPPPKSAIGNAINYALNQWEYLKRYIEYGEAEIDNNWVENQIRPFALGRKNWMFIGNKDAADTAAFFYSIIQTCKLNNIECHKYLTYVLNQAGKMRRHEVAPKILLPQFIDKNLMS
jgi:transposase